MHKYEYIYILGANNNKLFSYENVIKNFKNYSEINKYLDYNYIIHGRLL
jgi:hypothetical protein